MKTASKMRTMPSKIAYRPDRCQKRNANEECLPSGNKHTLQAARPQMIKEVDARQNQHRFVRQASDEEYHQQKHCPIVPNRLQRQEEQQHQKRRTLLQIVHVGERDNCREQRHPRERLANAEPCPKIAVEEEVSEKNEDQACERVRMLNGCAKQSMEKLRHEELQEARLFIICELKLKHCGVIRFQPHEPARREPNLYRVVDE